MPAEIPQGDDVKVKVEEEREEKKDEGDEEGGEEEVGAHLNVSDEDEGSINSDSDDDYFGEYEHLDGNRAVLGTGRWRRALRRSTKAGHPSAPLGRPIRPRIPGHVTDSEDDDEEEDDEKEYDANEAAGAYLRAIFPRGRRSKLFQGLNCKGLLVESVFHECYVFALTLPASRGGRRLDFLFDARGPSASPTFIFPPDPAPGPHSEMERAVITTFKTHARDIFDLIEECPFDMNITI
jgi:hypothetical protein